MGMVKADDIIQAFGCRQMKNSIIFKISADLIRIDMILFDEDLADLQVGVLGSQDQTGLPSDGILVPRVERFNFVVPIDDLMARFLLF